MADPTDYQIRREACRLAALVMQAHDPEYALAPTIWSTVVFFEEYLRTGSRGTMKDFGPKKPVKLRRAK